MTGAKGKQAGVIAADESQRGCDGNVSRGMVRVGRDETTNSAETASA